MRSKRIIIPFLLALLLASVLGSCVDPFPFDPPLPENILVVDGSITDQQGPVEIRLSTAAAYGNVIDTNNFNKPVTDAIVRIKDDQGRTAIFEHSNTTPGLYQTSNIQGEIGRTYSLEINWDEKTYLSRPETMPPSVPLDTVYAELLSERGINEFGIESDLCYYQIRVNVQDPAGEANHYLWRYRYIHELVLNTNVSTPDQCFIFAEENSQFGLTNDAFVDGNPILDFPIGRITYNYWHPKFLIDAEQFSLTPEAYNYWNQIKQQNFNVGSVFDPPPSTLRGNVYCEDDTTQLAYGYFRASSVSTNYTFFRRPINDCFRDFIPEGFCFQYQNSSPVYPPDSRWR